MTASRLTAIARRFLSDRTFTLIAAPALADFEFNAIDRHVGDYVGVARALAGAAWEDATADSAALTFLALTMIPATYYMFFFLMWAPAGLRVTTQTLAVLGAAVLLVSIVPVAFCYWPEKAQEQSADTEQS